jgi:hypothetical protein
MPHIRRGEGNLSTCCNDDRVDCDYQLGGATTTLLAPLVVDVPATVFEPLGRGVPATPSEGLVLLLPVVLSCAEVPFWAGVLVFAAGSPVPAAAPFAVGPVRLDTPPISGNWAMAGDPWQSRHKW